jgi:hypothetical protein
MQQLGVRIPSKLIDAIDSRVDGISYRSRAHLVTLIISEWAESVGIVIEKDTDDKQLTIPGSEGKNE